MKWKWNRNKEEQHQWRKGESFASGKKDQKVSCRDRLQNENTWEKTKRIKIILEKVTGTQKSKELEHLQNRS